MDEPTWLSRQVVEIIHVEQLAEHGGRPGPRDEGALESAMARPRHLLTYDSGAPLARLAAVLGVGIVRDHPFVDGNKRVALLAMYAFLAVNGRDLDADEMEAAEVIEAVAAGALNDAGLEAWIAGHLA